MQMKFAGIAAFLAAMASVPGCAAPLRAAPAVALASDVFVERTAASVRVLEPASRFRPGERIITVVTWRRAGTHERPASFVLTNPLPRGLQFEASADDAQEVSVDGGRQWGRIGVLRVGQRLATPEDVTHIRWRISTSAPSGRIAYSAIVR